MPGYSEDSGAKTSLNIQFQPENPGFA